MTVILPKGSLITLNGVDLSEHNRSGAQIDRDPIQIGERTIIGTMRRQHITSKRKISVSWERLPGLDSQTVDGKAGRNSIRDIVDAHWSDSAAPITLIYREVDSDNNQITTTISCFIESYNEELVKRLSYQHWNVSISFVEV